MNQKLKTPPFSNSLGMEIFAKVNQEDWDKWRTLQTKIINEYRLDMAEIKDREKLLKQMRIFLKLDNQLKPEDSIMPTGNPS